jgi:hypothetical protein
MQVEAEAALDPVLTLKAQADSVAAAKEIPITQQEHRADLPQVAVVVVEVAVAQQPMAE